MHADLYLLFIIWLDKIKAIEYSKILNIVLQNSVMKNISITRIYKKLINENKELINKLQNDISYLECSLVESENKIEYKNKQLMEKDEQLIEKNKQLVEEINVSKIKTKKLNKLDEKLPVKEITLNTIKIIKLSDYKYKINHFNDIIHKDEKNREIFISNFDEDIILNEYNINEFIETNKIKDDFMTKPGDILLLRIYDAKGIMELFKDYVENYSTNITKINEKVDKNINIYYETDNINNIFETICKIKARTLEIKEYFNITNEDINNIINSKSIQSKGKILEFYCALNYNGIPGKIYLNFGYINMV